MLEYSQITDQIFTVSDFFTAADCEAYIALAEGIGFTDAPITTAFGPVMRKDIRNNTRVILDDQGRADDLWARIRNIVPERLGPWEACGVNERFRFYRYDPGQQFDWHFDGYFERDNGERSQLTFMVYLNDGFTGGSTTIEQIDITPREGMALFFVHKIRHKGQPIISGRKYVLRTDVMYRRSG